MGRVTHAHRHKDAENANSCRAVDFASLLLPMATTSFSERTLGWHMTRGTGGVSVDTLRIRLLTLALFRSTAGLNPSGEVAKFYNGRQIG